MYPPPPQSSIHALLGLSYVIWKDLCEARVNLEVCSYLADEPSLADGSPSESGIDALNTAIPNLADKPTLDNGPPHPPSKSRIDALNTSTPNLAGDPTLANGPPL